MRSRWLIGLVAVICMITAAIAFSGCTTILGTFDVAPASSGAAAGTACDAGSQCGSTFCSDGVCCESACSGTCEACNLPGLAGKCSPVPDGQDPALECPTEPLPVVDAGTDDIVDAGVDDSGDAAILASDAGITFALPEAGVTTADSQCAGSCNGQRACKYPGTDRTCGTTFCSTPSAQGRAACDTKGHCLVGTETCQAYSCADGTAGCKAACTAESDCQPAFFCDALSSTCKPKLGNGSACSSVAQCGEGHCVSGVCCNDECKGFPGATCTSSGHAGECRCDACASGTCQLFYRDADGDTFGDNTATTDNGRAVPGCVGAPPAGYVANNTDCLDDGPAATAALVHPGQASFFGNAYNGHTGTSFDYDCSGLEDKSLRESIGGTCQRCTSSGIPLCSRTTTCVDGAATGFSCGLRRLCPIGTVCPSCPTDTTPAFTVAVPCGGNGTLVQCGTCSGTTLVGTTGSTRQQLCH